MANDAESDIRALLISPLHRAVYQILLEAGFKEGKGSDPASESEGPPVGTAVILTMVLSSFPSEDQLLDAMTWGQGREHWDALRPIARKLLALTDAE